MLKTTGWVLQLLLMFQHGLCYYILVTPVKVPLLLRQPLLWLLLNEEGGAGLSQWVVWRRSNTYHFPDHKLRCWGHAGTFTFLNPYNIFSSTVTLFEPLNDEFWIGISFFWFFNTNLVHIFILMITLTFLYLYLICIALHLYSYPFFVFQSAWFCICIFI